MTIVVIGKSGQVARALQRAAAEQSLPIVALGRSDFDLEHPQVDVITSLRPSVVINAAAYTEVDNAEDAPERAFAINAIGPEATARAASEVGAAFIHYSTDYVFSGDKSEPYVETDVVGPTGVYGASKLEGERRIRSAAEKSVILRTAWVFDPNGKNFVRTMLRLAKNRDEVSVVGDQFGCPTYAPDLAVATLKIAAMVASEAAPYGIYHCAGAGETSWAGFASEVFRHSRARGGPSASVLSIATEHYPTKARRPASSRLDCSKLERDYNVTMPSWTDSVAACVQEIAAGGWGVE